MKFKVGDQIKLTKDYTKWSSENADKVHGFPDLMFSAEENAAYQYNDRMTLSDRLEDWFFDKYNYIRGYEVLGHVIAEPETVYGCYLVWLHSPLGHSCEWLEPEQMELL